MLLFLPHRSIARSDWIPRLLGKLFVFRLPFGPDHHSWPWLLGLIGKGLARCIFGLDPSTTPVLQLKSTQIEHPTKVMRCKVRKTFRLPPFKSFPLLLLYLYYFMLLYNNNPTCAQRRTALLQPLQHHNNNHGMGNLNKRYRCIIPITIKSFMQARKRASPSLMALCDIGFLLLFDLTYVSRSRNLVSRKSIWKGWLSSGHPSLSSL